MESYIGNRPITEVSGNKYEWLTPENENNTFWFAYMPGYLDVYVDGRLLDSTEFTATTGSNFSLTVPVVAGQTVKARAWAAGEQIVRDTLSRQFAYRNLLRNGNFAIRQRGDGPFTGDGVFTIDGWRLVGSTTSAVSSISLSNGSRALQLTVDAGEDISLVQRGESPHELSDSILTLQLLVQGGTTLSQSKIGIRSSIGFGTGGDANLDTEHGVVTLSGSTETVITTLQIPDLSAANWGAEEDRFVQLAFVFSHPTWFGG